MDTLCDCWLTEGELDPKWVGHYLQNDKLKTTKVKHNVTQTEAMRWHQSAEVRAWAANVEANGLTPSYYWTLASED